MKWIRFVIGFFYFFSAWSNPTGHEVMYDGNAEISTSSSNICRIKTRDQTLVIHWNDFSIQTGEMTHFMQPSETSIILNRVIGDAPSEIYGKLQANGQLVLLNQNGIVFGKNGRVNVGALIASTLNLSDEDFLKRGSLTFKGLSKEAIINHGTIHSSSGDVTLLSHHILNTGTIRSPKGNVELVCGSEILLKVDEKQHIFIRAQMDQGEKSELGVSNEGEIKAIQTYLLADGNLYDYAIKNEGTIDALTVKGEGGQIFLSAEKGNLSVLGDLYAPGGTLFLLAENIFVMDDAHLSVSDSHRGGSIHLGKGETYASNMTFVSERAHLEASAKELGHGGEIICYSEGVAFFLGHAELRGGSLGGDGGFIEVSGKKATIFQGTTDRFAPFGKNGHLLIDPEANFKISSSYNYNYESLPFLKKPVKDLANLTIDTLIAELNRGPVTIQTAYQGEAGTLGHLLIESDVSHTYNSPHSLSFYCSGKEGIIWNGSLMNLGTGAIELFSTQGDVQFISNSSETPAFIQTSGNLSVGTRVNPIQGKVTIQGSKEIHAGLKTVGSGNLSIYAKKGISLISDEKAPAFIEVENGNAHIETLGRLLLHGRGHARAEILSRGSGNLSIIGADSIHLLAESAPALISFSHQCGHLLIQDIKNDIQLSAEKDQAMIAGGAGEVKIVDIGSDMNLFAHQAPASISSYGPVTLHILGDIHLDASYDDAYITSSDLLQINCEKNLIVNANHARASLSSSSVIQLNASQSILLTGSLEGEAFIKGLSSHIFAGHNLELFTNSFISGNSSPLCISVGNDLLMNNPLYHVSPSIFASEIRINIGNQLYLTDQSSISANYGALDLLVGDTAYFEHSSRLYSNGGPLHLTALRGNIHLTEASEAISASDSLTLSAGNSIILDGFSKIKSYGDQGMTLIVDYLYPNGVGNGGFILSEKASLETSHAPLAIYTSRRENNVIRGTLNGLRTISPLLYINTQEEQWGAFYPTSDLVPSFEAIPFTVFHKEDGLIQVRPLRVTQRDFTQIVVNFIAPFTAELFRQLHPYDEYTADAISFSTNYCSKELRNGSEHFFIKRAHFRHRGVPEIKIPKISSQSLKKASKSTKKE